MRRSISLLVVILVLQLGLTALLAARRNPLAATTPQTALITAPLDHVDHIIIEGQPPSGVAAASVRVELVKQADHWVLPNYFNAPVDKFRLSSMLSELASLKRGLPVATSSSALKRFKVVDAGFERKITLREGNKVLSTVFIGSSAGVRRADARTAQDHAVYEVDLATYELPISPSDWLDEDLLQRDPGSLTEMDIDRAAHSALKLLRSAPAPQPAASSAAGTAAKTWVDPSLPAGRQLDSARADNLAREVAELHVEGILGESPEPQWQPDHPALTLRIRDDRRPDQLATWTLFEPMTPAAVLSKRPHPAAAQPSANSLETYYVLKDSAQPWYFKLSSTAAKQLLDDSSPDELLAAAAPTGKAANHAHALVKAAARPPHPTRTHIP